MNDFWLCFVPLFVAVDAVGSLPIFLTMTHNLDQREAHRVIYLSTGTAAGLALAFAAAGPQAMHLLGITVTDFMVAGGTLLLILALTDQIVSKEPQDREAVSEFGVVPLGVPLMTGPAVLTTSILLVDQYGLLATSASILANVAIAGVVFRFGRTVHRFLGATGAKIISKVAGLFLAAIGVMMIRKGIEGFLGISAL